jgi:glycosyltransferase involved in cell wall biosynthesis
MSTLPKLSICISTFNRAAFIGETLESILPQVTNDCEIIVSDNASQDDTETVVAEFACRCEHLRYIKQNSNDGMDRNYDRAVELARGEYCWLLSDDDPLKPGAVATVLNALTRDFSLVLVNSEVRDATLSNILMPRYCDIDADRVYEPQEMDRLFSDMEPYLNFISSYIIKRTIWRERERAPYYGSLFLFLAVVFQKRLPDNTLVLAEPLINCRFANSHTFSSKLFEVGVINWPTLVWSLGISDAAIRQTPREAWRDSLWLLMWRGSGHYSISEYTVFVRPRLRSPWEHLVALTIAILPGAMVNALCMVYFSWTRQPTEVLLLRESRFHPRNWRILRRAGAR